MTRPFGILRLSQNARTAPLVFPNVCSQYENGRHLRSRSRGGSGLPISFGSLSYASSGFLLKVRKAAALYPGLASGSNRIVLSGLPSSWTPVASLSLLSYACGLPERPISSLLYSISLPHASSHNVDELLTSVIRLLRTAAAAVSLQEEAFANPR